MALPLIDFSIPYQYYSIQGRETDLPSEAAIPQMMNVFNDIISPVTNINIRNAATVFKNKINSYIKELIEIEYDCIRNAIGEEGLKVYQSLYNDNDGRNQIIFLTEVYFTGTSHFLKETTNLQNKNYIEIDVKSIKNNPMRAFLLIASSNEFTKLMKQHESAITMKRSEINAIQQDIVLKGDQEKSESALKILQEVFSKNELPIIKNKTTGKQINNSTFKQIKEIITNANTWSGLKKKVKEIIKNESQNLGGEGFNSIIILTDENDKEIPLATFQIIIDATEYQNKIIQELDGFQPISENGKCKLNFISFNIEIDTNDIENLKNSAITYAQSNDFLKKIADPVIGEKETRWEVKANISSASGALGEITALLGGESLLKSSSGMLTGTEKFNGVSSFADVKFQNTNTGLNVKHYNKTTFTLYPQKTYSILSDQILEQYIKTEDLLAMKYIEINYKYFYLSNYAKENNLTPTSKFKEKLSNQYQIIALNNLSGFFRQTSEYEPDYQNVFYIINNSVISASRIFMQLLNTFKVNELKDIFFKDTKANPLDVDIFDAKQITSKTNLLDVSNFSTNKGGYINFNGLRISVEALSKYGQSKLSINNALE